MQNNQITEMSLISSSVATDDRSVGRRHRCEHQPSQRTHCPYRVLCLQHHAPRSPQRFQWVKESPFCSLWAGTGLRGSGASPPLPVLNLGEHL